ncbi:MAG TPA: EamA family transporter [Micromonosporaceae bacterium]|jgi:drug/metabolite transporter (DMT)-like permease
MSESSARSRVIRHAAPLASAGLVITWSSGFIGAELTRRAHADPLTVLGWRFVLLSGLLLAACRVTGTSLRSWQSWLRQGTLAVLCQVIYLGLVFEGIHRGVAGGTAALVAALQPLLVATVAGRLLGERSTPIMWVGMVLGLGGVAVVVSGDLESSGTPAWAFALPVAGMLSLAAGTVLTRRLRPSETMLQTITIQAVVTAIAFMAAAVGSGEAAPPNQPKAWLAIGWLIVLASLGGYVLYIHVTHTLGATVVSTLLYLTPPVTMLWAFAMFGDPVTGLGLLGLVISGAGVFLTLRGRRGSRATDAVSARSRSRTGRDREDSQADSPTR